MGGFDYVTNDGLVYEAVFRHYRNAVVAHIRTCLTTEYGANGTREALEGTLGQQWSIRLRSNIDNSAARGVVSRARVDLFDLLDVNHFHTIFEKHHDALVGEEWQGATSAASRRALCGWAQEVKDARDPEAHPGSEDVAVMDAIRVVDSCVRVVLRLGANEGRDQLEEILAELQRRSSRPEEQLSLSALDDSLPPAETVVDDFVGRSAELETLREWLRHPRKRRWMLVGDGGKGKSSTAYAFAREVLEAAPPGLCAVFWMSAKRRRYSEDRVVDIAAPDFADLGECLDRLLLDYGHSGMLDRPLEEKRVAAIELLNELPCLLVIDDLDSVDKEEEEVIEFLTLEAPTTASKILFTSRREFLGMGATSTTIGGLPTDEALAFIETRWEGLGRESAALPDGERLRIAATCDGSPLYMGDLLRLVAITLDTSAEAKIADVVDDWVSKSGDTVRRYALQREMDMLTRDARSVLQALAIGGRPLTVVEVSQLADMEEFVVRRALEELSSLYLVPARALDEETPRYGLGGNLTILVRAQLSGTVAEAKLVNALAAIDGKTPETGDSRSAEIGQLADIVRQSKLLSDAGRLAAAEETLRRGLEELPDTPVLLAMLGYVCADARPPRTTEAASFFKRAADLRYGDRGMYLKWSRLEREAARYGEAIQAAMMGLEASERRDALLLLYAGQAAIAAARGFEAGLAEARAREAFERADEWLEEASSVARDRRLPPRSVSLAFREWTRSAVVQKRPAAVCFRLRRWSDWRAGDRDLTTALEAHRRECEDFELKHPDGAAAASGRARR